MNNYMMVVPETMVASFMAVLPGVQFLPIGAVQHAEDPERKKYLVNIEPEKSHEQVSG